MCILAGRSGADDANHLSDLREKGRRRGILTMASWGSMRIPARLEGPGFIPSMLALAKPRAPGTVRGFSRLLTDTSFHIFGWSS